MLDMARGSDRETESEGPRGLAEEAYGRSDTQKGARAVFFIPHLTDGLEVRDVHENTIEDQRPSCPKPFNNFCSWGVKNFHH